MKYYVYVSDTKLNMLFDQLPVPLREKLATELKIDLKFLSTTFAEQPSEKNRYLKLDAITKYIDANEPIGSIDNPDIYFRGTLPMRWGPISAPQSNGDRPIVVDAVFFAGRTLDTLVGLGGSPRFVIGTEPIEASGLSSRLSPSAYPALAEVLRKLLDTEMERQDQVATKSPELHLDYIIGNLADARNIPMQTLEFLAKRLAYIPGKENEYEPSAVLLGSPIYVALAE